MALLGVEPVKEVVQVGPDALPLLRHPEPGEEGADVVKGRPALYVPHVGDESRQQRDGRVVPEGVRRPVPLLPGIRHDDGLGQVRHVPVAPDVAQRVVGDAALPRLRQVEVIDPEALPREIRGVALHQPPLGEGHDEAGVLRLHKAHLGVAHGLAGAAGPHHQDVVVQPRLGAGRADPLPLPQGPDLAHTLSSF